MKQIFATLALVASLAGSAEAQQTVVWPNDPNTYQIKVVEAAREALYAVTLVQHSVQLTKQDKDPLKVCHSLGVLHSTMVHLANWAMNGYSTHVRKTSMNQIMPLVAELNTFCRVPSNLSEWKPKDDVRTPRDIEIRLERIQFIVEKIAAGQIR